jgi:signal transduction histidine kinase/CheY-like chemotaxis protein
MLQGQRDLNTVTKRILSELAQVVTAHYGAFYILQQEEGKQKLKLFSAYAYQDEDNIPAGFSIGEGLVGQCAFEKELILLTNVPDGYVRINSGLGRAKPSNLIVLPVLFENNVKAVIELASLDSFSKTHLDFLGQLTESIGIVLNTIETNTRTEELLAQSQSLARELKSQQEELRITNEELQDKALLLVKQKEEVEVKNREVEEARRSLEDKAEQLTLTSKYKSEFLANMSHELRTPLNSLLILAQQLYENPEGNLNPKQIGYAKTIHSCSDDLTQLINNILDLSKVESGFITANVSSVRIADIASFVETTFKPISEAKNIKFTIETDESLALHMETDEQRLNQILKNLLSNALKFTERGEVSLKIFKASRGWMEGKPSLDHASAVIAFSIRDTGIGISQDKQLIIFEAFQQAEGSTSRKYGGTGLGLSISRGLTELLGGTIELDSQVGLGSTFTLFLPLERPAKSTTGDLRKKEHTLLSMPKQAAKSLIKDDVTESLELEIKATDIGDDRAWIQSHDKLIIVVDTDLVLGKKESETIHARNFKVIIATNYLEVLDFVHRFPPTAIILNIKPMEVSGWRIISLLHNDLNYRHIPIYVISGEENRVLAFKRGARNFLLRPLTDQLINETIDDIISLNSKEIKSILIGESDPSASLAISKIHRAVPLVVTTANSGLQAIELIQNKDFDCILLDSHLSGISCSEIIDASKQKNKLVPVIIHSSKGQMGQNLSDAEPSSGVFILRENGAVDHLLDETLSHLNINHKSLTPEVQKIIENIHGKEDILSGKNILIVDDDVRNLFTLTTVFERYDINVITAESGKEAIKMLKENPKIDLVLMDIMMPEMDGYETTRRIRLDHKNSALPIIAVTAKAMRSDRQKCIDAGASDYIIKPVKIDQLVSLMRLWFL